ncbi:hypothetical protein VE26_00005, partial [Devosia chinhatensis]
MEWASGRDLGAIFGLFYVQDAQNYVFTVWLRAKEAGAVCRLALAQNGDDRVPARQSGQLAQGGHAALVDSDNLV